MEEEILDVKRENYKLRKENFELIQDNVKLQEEKEMLHFNLTKTVMDNAREIDKIKGDLKYVLDQTLGAFTENWCIDWNFADIREKYGLEEK